jgi:hypothetical protein
VSTNEHFTNSGKKFYPKQGSFVFGKQGINANTNTIRDSYSSNLRTGSVIGSQQFQAHHPQKIPKKTLPNHSTSSIRLNPAAHRVTHQNKPDIPKLPQRRGSTSLTRKILSGQNSFRSSMEGRKNFVSNLKNSNIIQANTQNAYPPLGGSQVYSKGRTMRSSGFRASYGKMDNGP